MSRISKDVEPRGRVRYGKRRRRGYSRRKRRLPILIIVLLLLLIAGGVAAGVLAMAHFSPTRKRADLEQLYGAEEGYASIVLNREWSEKRAVWEDGRAYLGVDLVCGELNDRFFWDQESQTLLYTGPKNITEIDASTTHEGFSVLLERPEGMYVSLSYVEANSDIQADTYENPKRVVIQSRWGEVKSALCLKESVLRVRGGIKSPVIADIYPGDELIILEIFDNWVEVQSPEGWIGYVGKEVIGEITTATMSRPDRQEAYTSLSVDHPVCLMWQQSMNSSCKPQLETLLKSKAMESVNVVAPSWFSITDVQGSFTGRASAEYVQLAHENGLEVWAVLENVNHPNVDMAALLSSSSHRRVLVNGVMEALISSGADGLNVDIEDIPQAAGPGYIQLLRELSIECHKKGLILSVDDPVPSAWTKYYNRRAQGEIVDYFIIMGYDEHFKSSESAGSTASLEFVRAAVTETLEEVPEEKVICGIPFYSRLWKVKDGKLSSEAIGMDGIQKFIAKYEQKPEWKSDLGQNYLRVEDDGVTYEIWVEDGRSTSERLEMLTEFPLAGIACWRQGLQSEDVWAPLTKYFKQ